MSNEKENSTGLAEFGFGLIGASASVPATFISAGLALNYVCKKVGFDMLGQAITDATANDNIGFYAGIVGWQGLTAASLCVGFKLAEKFPKQSKKIFDKILSTGFDTTAAIGRPIDNAFNKLFKNKSPKLN
jgi:hypothetical protein